MQVDAYSAFCDNGRMTGEAWQGQAGKPGRARLVEPGRARLAEPGMARREQSLVEVDERNVLNVLEYACRQIQVHILHGVCITLVAPKFCHVCGTKKKMAKEKILNLILTLTPSLHSLSPKENVETHFFKLLYKALRGYVHFAQYARAHKGTHARTLAHTRTYCAKHSHKHAYIYTRARMHAYTIHTCTHSQHSL